MPLRTGVKEPPPTQHGSEEYYRMRTYTSVSYFESEANKYANEGWSIDSWSVSGATVYVIYINDEVEE